jgi:hypothetical protein
MTIEIISTIDYEADDHKFREDSKLVQVKDSEDKGTWRSATVIRCGSCAATVTFINIDPDLEGNCPVCSEPLVIE